MNDLIGIEPRDLYQDPLAMQPALAIARQMAEMAALMRRWPEMTAAIDILIERQQTVVAWWDDHVRSQGEVHKKMQAAHFLSVADAERTIHLRQDQVSRFRTALQNLDAYRARLIAQVHREVGLANASDDPAALRPTPTRIGPDFWPTPRSLIKPLVELILPRLPHAAVWECAAGDYRLVDPMMAAGCQVFASDLYPQNGGRPRDFLTTEPPRPGMIVITNPPYNASDAFLGRGLALLDRKAILGLVLLLRHDHLQAASRVDTFNRAAWELHCNWRPIWIDGTEGQPRWSFHWIVWTDQQRHAPLYVAEAA